MTLAGKITSFLLPFIIPKIKNHKIVRDLQDKWLKDNYSQKVKLMFEAAIDDAKAAIGLPDELVDALLNDEINREEIFRWIIEGVTFEHFNQERLNVEPYMERYPMYQDFIVPFFMLIFPKVIEYKEKHWDPEFLQILGQVELLHQTIKQGFERVEKDQVKVYEVVKETNTLLKYSIETIGYEDLNQLLNSGKILKARELAQDRLKKKHIHQQDLRELNAIIASSYITSGFEEDAIPNLYTVMTLCDNEARKKRTFSLINMFQNNLKEAYSLVMEAIEIEGYSVRNVEILVNIHIQEENYRKAIALIKENPSEDFDLLMGQAMLFLKEYDQVIELAEKRLRLEANSRDWLMLKADALVLKQEYLITEKKLYTHIKQTFDEVIPILTVIEKDNENERQLMRINELKAGMLFRLKRFAESAMYYHKVYDLGRTRRKEYFSNLITSYYLAGNWDQAIVLLKEKVTNESCELSEIIFFARIYLEAGKPEDAICLLKDYQNGVNKDKLFLHFTVTLMEALFISLRLKEIDLLLEELHDSDEITVLKGHYALLQHNWEEAINLLENGIIHLKEETLIDTNMELIRAYEKRGKQEDFQKIIRLIPTIPHWMMHESLFNRYIYALFQLGNYTKILSYYNGDEIPYKSSTLIELATVIYFNFQWYDIAKVNFKRLYHETRNIRYLFQYANCLFRLGETEECHETLSRAEFMIKTSGTIEDYNLLSIAFRDAFQYEKSLEYAYKTYQVGQNNPSVLKFYFWNFLQLSQFVENPKKEWVDAYTNIFNEYNKQFPDEETLYTQYKAFDDEGNISKDIINVLKDTADHNEHFINFYKNYKIPGMLFAQLMNKGLFDTWGFIANEQKMDTWVYNGEYRELKNGILTVRQANNVLCDIFTLLSFNYLGILDKLSDTYNLFIYQDQFDKIHEEFTQTKLVQDIGVKTIAYESDGIVMQEMTSEYVKQVLQKQKEFVQWLNSHCTKIGKTFINNDSSIEEDKNFLAIVYDQLMVSKEQSYTYLIDSSIIRDLANQHYSVPSFNLIDFINDLLLKKEIATTEYYEKISILMKMGYLLIPVKSELYTHFLEKNHYKLNEEMIILFQYLKRPELSEEFLLNIVVDLLRCIWLESIDNNERQIITDHLCYIVTFRKNKSETIDRVKKMSREKFGSLVQHQYEKMELCVNQWLQTQPII